MGNQEKETSGPYEIRYSEKAEKDIEELVSYIAFIKHQPVNAIKVDTAIIETIERIGHHPHAFRECEELSSKNKNYRRATCMSWQIIYRQCGQK